MLLTEIKELVKLLMHVWFFTQSDDHTDYSQAALGSSTQAAPTPSQDAFQTSLQTGLTPDSASAGAAFHQPKPFPTWLWS